MWGWVKNEKNEWMLEWCECDDRMIEWMWRKNVMKECDESVVEQKNDWVEWMFK